MTFQEDRVVAPAPVPERPPPPAPVRQTSFQAVNNFLVQGISFGSQMTPNTGAAPVTIVAHVPQAAGGATARSQVDGPRNTEESLSKQNCYGITEESQYFPSSHGTRYSILGSFMQFRSTLVLHVSFVCGL